MKNIGPGGESNPGLLNENSAAITLSYLIFHLPPELLSTYALHLAYFTSYNTAHYKLEVFRLQGLERVG